MEKRRFTLKDACCIFCNLPCDKKLAVFVDRKVKGLKGTTQTWRCIAPGAAQRGQHFGQQEGHMEKLEANRVCLIYTNVDNTQTRG